MVALTGIDAIPWETGSVADDLLTTAEAAQALRVSLTTLQRWAKAGIVEPTLRLPGGRFRWDLDDLKRQLRARRDSTDDTDSSPD
jgi:excisionase family DNA binding protein